MSPVLNCSFKHRCLSVIFMTFTNFYNTFYMLEVKLQTYYGISSIRPSV